MNWIKIFITYFALSFALLAEGGGNFGLGLTLFAPTGITGKYKLDNKKAIEGSLGFGSFGQGRGFHLHGVFLYNFHQPSDAVSFYAGGGLVLGNRRYRDNDRGRGNWWRSREYDETGLGIRAPVGISWFPDKKFELSAELFMQVFLAGRTGADLGIALAGRYYF
jgi:hypothetical protein